MGRKFYLILVILFLSLIISKAQTGEIRGKVTEKGGIEIPFASIAALVNGIQVQATIADFEGNYSIKPLNPAKYDIKATSVGYSPVLRAGVIVTVDKISFVNVELSKGIEIKEVEVVDYQVPLIDVGTPTQQKTLTFEEIQALPTRDVNSAAVQSAGVYQKDEGGDLNIRGSRSDATSYYIDGIKVTGSPGVSQRGTEQITVITGGIPAQYGDATGGIISVTTRGPSNQFGGGVELATSEILDDFGYNLVSANLTGPIYKEKDENGNKTGQSVAGFFIAGEYQYDKDPSPSVIPIYKVKDDILSDVLVHPLVLAPTGLGYIHRSSFFTFDSLEKQKYNENVAVSAFRLNGKIDIRPAKNFTLTLGGSIERVKDNEFTASYSLMNYDYNPEKIDLKWRAFAKITQRFTAPENEKSSSAIKNAFYSIQVDYSVNDITTQNERHKKNFFDYGYVGNFKTYAARQFAISTIVTPDSSIKDITLFNQNGNSDTLIVYQAGNLNPNTSNYTTQYFDLTKDLPLGDYQDNLSTIFGKGALPNGDNRNGLNVYGLWSTPGRVPNQYRIQNKAQGRISASGSADIKNHNIIIGLEYEQRTERGYTINPNSLWTLMRQLSNQNLRDVDTTTANVTDFNFANGDSGRFVTYNKGLYKVALNKDSQETRGFYENFRKQIGVENNDTVQTDNFDPSTFNINLFTPDELFNSGNSIINYFGYDYTGEKKTNGSWDLKDFYVYKNEDNNNNNYLRKIDAFRPVYMAGYIQDRFTYNDIIFNVGLRVDRFDANQKVLKDPYSLYDTYKAGNAIETRIPKTVVPSNIGKDYVVYVNNIEKPTEVVGYRNENVWYDKNGTVITNLDPLTKNGTIQPYLIKPEDYKKTSVNPTGFKDYTPQVSVMPRIAFSFPISDEAYFAAHYDVLTQRPQSSALLRFNPINYLDWSQAVSGDYTNPNLKPEKTTVYEINFQQKLSRSSAFSITAFYKEMKDNIQAINVDFAFPIQYTTYGNIDFGTVKGLTFSYDLRRTSNLRMNLSYTLQFADGTGSKNNGSAGILSQAGQTNLREIKPLDFDQRHTLVTAIDFHYGQGKDYNGPVWFKKQFFANSGLNFVFHAGSGTPYTRKANITPTADFTTTANSRSVISGSINGSRYPWNFRIDAKIDKDFAIKTSSGKEGESGKSVFINVYLQVLNVLNTENINSVYTATGSPSDDGYLSSAGAQTKINQQSSPAAYSDLYHVKVNDPNNYDLPRRIRLGVQVNF